MTVLIEDEPLSPHFMLSEMLRSDNAERLGIAEQYSPPPAVIDMLKTGCQTLEIAREAICIEMKQETAIHISSAYRCEALNAATPGSADHSQHQVFDKQGKLLGCAFDTHVQGMTIEEWYQFLRHLARTDPRFKFGQLIQEFGNWVHIGQDPPGATPRMQCLRATRGINAQPIYTADPL